MKRSPADLVFFITLLVAYALLALWMSATWKPLGDEPHYLLATHSLVVDRDLDLANNYAQGDFQAFLAGDALDPHVKILPGGTQLLIHDLGLPILAALPYAVGGRVGVELFLALCGALLTWQMYQLARDVTARPLWSALSALLLGFTPPLVLYATLVYPEVVGALIFLAATRAIFFYASPKPSALRLAGIAAALLVLPWLSVRFIVPAVLLLVFIVLQWSDARRRVVIFFAIGALSLIFYFAINNVLLAGTVPRGNPTELASGNLATLSLTSLARGVLGWWIDPQRGTLIMAPIYILALAGIPRLMQWNRRLGLALLAPLLVLVPLVDLLGGFWIPFEVGARYFVVALPLLAAPLALTLSAAFHAPARWQRVVTSAVAVGLSALSLWNGLLMLTDASYAYGSVVSAYNRVVGSDLSPYFSGMGHGLVISPRNTPADSSVASLRERQGEPIWHTDAAQAGTIISSFDLTELTVGHYALRFRAAAGSSADGADALTLDLYSAEGLPLVHGAWTAHDLAAPSLNPTSVEFDNPYFDRWGFPLTLQLESTGEAALDVSGLYFDPDNTTTWLRAAVWVVGILGLIVVFNADLIASRLAKSV